MAGGREEGSEARKFVKIAAWCKSKSRKRRERRSKKNQHRRAEQERHNTLGGMFWNARGIGDKVDEVIAYMEMKNLAFCMVSESRNYGRNLSRGKKWRWLAGSEWSRFKFYKIGITSCSAHRRRRFYNRSYIKSYFILQMSPFSSSGPFPAETCGNMFFFLDNLIF